MPPYHGCTRGVKGGEAGGNDAGGQEPHMSVLRLEVRPRRVRVRVRVGVSGRSRPPAGTSGGLGLGLGHVWWVGKKELSSLSNCSHILVLTHYQAQPVFSAKAHQRASSEASYVRLYHSTVADRGEGCQRYQYRNM